MPPLTLKHNALLTLLIVRLSVLHLLSSSVSRTTVSLNSSCTDILLSPTIPSKLTLLSLSQDMDPGDALHHRTTAVAAAAASLVLLLAVDVVPSDALVDAGVPRLSILDRQRGVCGAERNDDKGWG